MSHTLHYQHYLSTKMAAMRDIVPLLAFLCLVHHVTCESPCQDIDSLACQLMAQRDPGLCENIGLAETACRRFCGFCPLVCYHCDTTVRNTSDCVNMKLCAAGERCLLARMQSSADVEYKMTCATVDQCDASDLLGLVGRRAGGATRSLSKQCCTRDLCNKPVDNHDTTTTSATSTTTMLTTSASTLRPTENVRTTVGSTTSAATQRPTGDVRTTVGSTTSAMTPRPTEAVLNVTCIRDIEIVVEDNRQTLLETQHIKDFLKQIVSSLDISPLTNQVGLALVSDDTEGAEHLDSTKAQLLLDIDALKFQHNGPELDIDDLASALSGRKHDVTGGRSNVDNVVVLVLDNNARASDLDRDDLQKLARLSHDVIVVKVGGSPTESRTLKTPIFETLATDLNHVLNVPDYQSLATINPQLLALLCS